MKPPRHFFLLISVLFFLPLFSSFSANEIKVVRPQPGEELTISEGYTYVIGTVPSDQWTLRCNGKLCDVYSDGAFIGYIPLKPLASPQTVNQKTMDVVFEFKAAKGKEKLAKTITCMTPSSPSTKKIATEKFPEPRLVETLSDQWMSLENALLPDRATALNLGKVVFFPKGCKIFVKEKRGSELLLTEPIENAPLWINENDVKFSDEKPASASVKQEFFSERTEQFTLYRFDTPTPIPLVCEETADGQTMKFHFLSQPPQAFVLPQPKPVWGFEANFENGQTFVKVKYAPTIDPKKPFQGLKILLDPGYNFDSEVVGPRGTGGKTLALLLSKQLFEILKSKGAEPILLPEGKPLSLLEQRAKFKTINPDLVIGIDFNASEDNKDPKNTWGTQSIYLLPNTMPLAKAVQRSLMPVIQGHDLFYQQRGLPLTRYPAAPVVVIKSNMIMPDEEKRLLTKEYRDQLAAAISEGISNFLLGEKPATR